MVVLMLTELHTSKVHVTTTKTKDWWENINPWNNREEQYSFKVVYQMTEKILSYSEHLQVDRDHTHLKDFPVEAITAFSDASKFSSLSNWFGRVNESKHDDAKMEGTWSNFTLILLRP